MKNVKIISLLNEAGVLALLLVATMSYPFATTIYADTLNRQLELKMTGSDVSTLQTFLAEDKTIYPQGLVTGYFGFLTKSAVSNFQSKNNIDPVGRVGPVTLARINAQMNDSKFGSDKISPTIYALNVSTTRSSATFSWNTSDAAAAIIYYSNQPLAMLEASSNTSVNISGSTLLLHTDLRTTHSGTITDLQPNTTYYYVVYAKDGSGNESVTTQLTFRTLN